jgi:phosphonate transport system substrate-binding protein
MYRFGLPPSVGLTENDPRLSQLSEAISAGLARPAQAVLTKSYQDLGKRMQRSELEAAWSPPFVAARLEALGFQVLLRGVRKGTSTYRSALIAANPVPSLDWLKGRRAVWVDQDSVSGYLLPLAFLKAKGFDLSKDFALQTFAGSFVHAVEKVLEGRADFTAVFAPPEGVQWRGTTGLDEMAPRLAPRVQIIAYTEAVPSSGLVVSSHADAETVSKLRDAMNSLGKTPHGEWLVEHLFQVDSFEAAPRMGYRALYKLAVATLW